MKKTIKTAIALVSAVSMLGTCAVPAFAGELSSEELIQKYAPGGAYQYEDIYTNPSGFPTVMEDGSTELAHNYIQKMEAEGLSLDEQLEELTAKFSNISGSKVSAYNDYRRGSIADGVQWFVNAEYENGFWYVLREDGTASIVGADQDWVEENSPAALQIPAEIGGVPVTMIEKNAFAYETMYNHGIREITVPDTVEIIGDGAFNTAMKGDDCKLNLPQSLKYIGRLAYYGTMQYLMDEYEVIKLPESVEFIGKRAFDTTADLHNIKNADAHKSHLRFFNPDYLNGVIPVDYLLDMPETPVFCEEAGMYQPIQSDKPDAEYQSAAATYYDRAFGDEPFFYLPASGTGEYIFDPADPDCSYLTVNDFLNDPDAVHETILGLDLNYRDYEADAMEHLYQDLAEQVQKVKAFADAYDTAKMPVNNAAMIAGGLALYNEYNIVTREDVENYYARPLAKPAAKAPAQLTGDVNCSGAVDVSDAVLLARFCAEDKTASITDAGLRNADANGDGNVSTEDVTRITEIIARR